MQSTRFTGFIILLVLAVGATGCTGTATTVDNTKYTKEPIALADSSVAILKFTGTPKYPETAPLAREIAMNLVSMRHRAKLISPSKIDAFIRDKAFLPSEHDSEQLQDAAEKLNAEVLLWGTLNQYTPYKFDRLAPATPPYVDITLYAFRVGHTDVAKVRGHKQGDIPTTIWDRQPTFDDVARATMSTLLVALH